MRSFAILIVIFLGTGIAIMLHADKADKTDIDRLSKALSGIKGELPRGSSLSFKAEPSKGELLPWARYVMAPHYLDVSGKYDTMLAIQYLHNSDSVLNIFISGRKIVWQHNDDLYRYTLTTHASQ